MLQSPRKAIRRPGYFLVGNASTARNKSSILVGMKLPEVRIWYAWLIDPVYRDAFFANPKNRRKRYPSAHAIRRRIVAYRRSWKAHESEILTGICRATGVGFEENIIRVHVVGRAPRSVSYPLVTYATHAPSEFVDVLTHELIHHIITENAKRVNFFPAITPFTRGKSMTVNVHVLVHAIHQYIYLDVLKDPSRLRRNLEWAQRHPPYRAAWKIVEKVGYQRILKRLRARARRSGKRRR